MKRTGHISCSEMKQTHSCDISRSAPAPAQEQSGTSLTWDGKIRGIGGIGSHRLSSRHSPWPKNTQTAQEQGFLYRLKTREECGPRPTSPLPQRAKLRHRNEVFYSFSCSHRGLCSCGYRDSEFAMDQLSASHRPKRDALLHCRIRSRARGQVKRDGQSPHELFHECMRRSLGADVSGRVSESSVTRLTWDVADILSALSIELVNPNDIALLRAAPGVRSVSATTF